MTLAKSSSSWRSEYLIYRESMKDSYVDNFLRILKYIYFLFKIGLLRVSTPLEAVGNIFEEVL